LAILIRSRGRKKRRSGWGLFNALLGVCILYAAGFDDGVPPVSRLRTVTGVVEREHCVRHAIDFKLRGQAREYRYASKSGAMAQVEHALAPGGAPVTLLFDPADPGGPLFAEKTFYPVYAVSVAGVSVRSHAQIREAWAGDNRVGLFLGVVFLVFAAVLAFVPVRR
jgi:hypothetical protein